MARAALATRVAIAEAERIGVKDQWALETAEEYLDDSYVKGLDAYADAAIIEAQSPLTPTAVA